MKNKIFFSFVSILLSVSIAASSIPKVAAIGESPTYISDVKIGYSQNNKADGAVEAKKSLTDAGYIVVDSDLNSGTGEGWSFIGYKTTKNKDEAITDLSIMDMQGGYKLNNYSATLSYYKESIKSQSVGLMAAAKELRSNYEKGSPAAELAYKTLNYMIVKEKNNQPLAEYLIDAERNEQEFYDIVLKCDPKILTFIYSQLSLGVADYKTDTWLERLSKADPYKEFDNDIYYDKVMKIYPNIQKFSEKYAEAQKATSDFKYEKTPEKDSNIPEEISTHTEENALKDSINTPKSEENKAVSEEHMMIRTVYNLLNEKTYDGIGIGEMLSDPYIDVIDLYPLWDALTEGQRAMMAITGVEAMTTNLVNNTKEAEKAKELSLIEIEKNSKDIKGVDLWSGVNNEAFEDREIAMTSKAVRESTAKNKLDAIARTDVTRENFDKSLKIVSGIAGVAFSMVTTAWFVMSSFYGATFAFSTIITTMGTLWTSAVGSAIATGIFGGGIVVLAMAIIAMLAVVFYYIVTAIQDLIAYNNPKYDEIPKEMYDYFEGVPDPDNPGKTIDKYIRYDAVLDQNGNPADLNTWQGLKWNALYSTKDKAAGNPILAHTFAVKYGDGSTNHEYSPLKKFGYEVAYNSNTHTYNDNKNGCYVFFMREGGNKEKVTGIYLSDIIVYEDDKEENALAHLTTQSYTPIMVNLVNDNKKFAFMGYKTTTNPDNAIIDIRIATNYDTEKIFIGEGSYANGGKYQNTSLYYTKKSATAGLAAGDPILADFSIKSNINEKPDEDYLPISLISGGPAANMCIGSEPYHIYPHNGNFNYNDMSQIYLYYKSSVSYTTGPDYISGITYFYANERMNVAKGAALNALAGSGYIYTGHNMAKSSSENPTYMGYSTTKNPKRALRKISTYYASDSSIAMPTFTSLNGIGYIATSTVSVYEGSEHENEVKFRTSIKKSNAYISSNGSTTMYVTSGTSQGAPFTKDEMIFSDTQLSTIPQSYYAVSNLMDYSFGAADIKKGNDSNEYLYLYLPGSKPQPKKYISSIVIGGSENGEAYSKLDLFNQGCEQALDLTIKGLYYDSNKKEDNYKWYYTNIGFTKTDNTNYAITDIKILPFQEDSAKSTNGPPPTVTINGCTYTRASEKPYAMYNYIYNKSTFPINRQNSIGGYAYYTKNPKAGKPILEVVSEQDNYFKDGYNSVQIYSGAANTKQLVENEYWNFRYKLFFKTENSGTKYISNIDAVSTNLGGRMIDIEAVPFQKLSENGLSYAMNADFNSYREYGKRGHKIYMGYDKTDNPDEAVTGVISLHQSGWDSPSTITKNGIVYTAINTKVDFNAGMGGDYIFLYYTKDPKAGSPLTGIMGTRESHISGWETCLNTQSWQSNFNSGCKISCYSTDPYYLFIKRANGVISNRPSIIASTFITPNPLVASMILIVLLITGVTLIIIQKRRKIKVKTRRK